MILHRFTSRRVGWTAVAILAVMQDAALAGSVTAVESSRPAPPSIIQWAMRLAAGSNPAAVAAQLGAPRFRPVGQLADTYVFDMPEMATEPERAAVARTLSGHPAVQWSEQQVPRQQHPRLPADPWFASQWHLNNTGQTGGTAGEDAAVLDAWDYGFSGAGVVIGIVDDGLQYNHPDISPNYRPDLSWNFDDDNPDPAPNPAADRHGTAVAGVAAARDDGAKCGVGAAYRAPLAGLRLTAVPSTDAMEASALSHRYDAIRIYNSSWGPQDDGLRLEGPGTLTRAAIADAIANGRNGLGSIYVWAGGNGAQNGDNANYDGYANSHHVIAVGAVNDNGRQTPYSEPGAPLLVVAPSSSDLVGIVTTDLLGPDGYNNAASPTGDCTNGFSGTSASAPIVAGVAALMLEANANLGWRDVKQLLLATATRNDPTNSEWRINGAGRPVHSAYGFGRVDAGRAVGAARQRTRNLGTQVVLDSGMLAVARHVPDGDTGGVTGSLNVDQALIVEQVEVIFRATHPRRGDLRVTLTSPAGTESVLADAHGDGNADYQDWRFMSVRHWGELSTGNWELKVADLAGGLAGTFDGWQLLLHGRQPVFADVGSAHWSWRHVEAIYHAGLTNGCGSGRYCPDDPVTRAQAAVLLERGLRGGAYSPPICTGSLFEDVGPTTFGCDWIEQLSRDGITSGCGAGRYCPDNPVTRTQAAMFLLRARHGADYLPPACNGTLFADVSTATYGCAWIEQLARERVTTGCGGGSYCPDMVATRAQMATFLSRVFGLVQP